MVTTANETYAMLLQLSAYTQYFFPFGNFIFPVLLWSIKKENSEFVNFNGRQAINFQLSILIYSIVLVIIAVPIFLCILFRDLNFNKGSNNFYISGHDINWAIDNFDPQKITALAAVAIIAGFILVAIKVAEFFFILYATVKNSNGMNYNFPLTINFIKPTITLPAAGKQV